MLASWCVTVKDYATYRRVDGVLLSQRTLAFSSVAYCRDALKQLTVADELESFLWVGIWYAVCFLRTNFDPSKVNDFLNDFTDYECYVTDMTVDISNIKVHALRFGGFASFEHIFKGYDTDGNLVYTPMNAFLDEYLHLCRAVFYVGECGDALIRRHPLLRDHVDPDYVEGPVDDVDVKELAPKLDDHVAVLELVNQALSKDWPAGDYVGNQIHMFRDTQRAALQERQAIAYPGRENAEGDDKVQNEGARDGSSKENGAAPSKKGQAAARASRKKTLAASRKGNRSVKKVTPQQQKDDKSLKRRRNPVRGRWESNQESLQERPVKRRRRN